MNSIATDKRALRNAYGQFATGICVVTTLDPQGQPTGLTVNSFNSVSLEPALVLWSLRKESWSAQAFEAADGFAINVLAEGQREVSDRFAKPLPDKFHSVGFALGKHNMPLIHGAIAQFECLKHRQLDGGDHWIFLGEVLHFSHAQGDPLIFHGGRYATAQPAVTPA